jgi:hypothetical protein
MLPLIVGVLPLVPDEVKGFHGYIVTTLSLQVKFALHGQQLIKPPAIVVVIDCQRFSMAFGLV